MWNTEVMVLLLSLVWTGIRALNINRIILSQTTPSLMKTANTHNTVEDDFSSSISLSHKRRHDQNSYADALIKALILSQYESSKEKTTTTKPDILSMVSEERNSASDIRQTIQDMWMHSQGHSKTDPTEKRAAGSFQFWKNNLQRQRQRQQQQRPSTYSSL